MGRGAHFRTFDEMQRLLLVLALSGLTACTSIRANADFAPGFDASSYRTFAMAPPPSEAPLGLPSYSEIRGRRVNEAIAERLEAKGFTRASDEADLVVSFRLIGEPRQDVRSTGSVSMGYGRYGRWYGAGWYEPSVYTVDYVRGTLIVDAFDRAAEAIVWHGWSSVSYYSESEAQDKGDRVLDAVLAEFPARPAAALVPAAATSVQ